MSNLAKPSQLLRPETTVVPLSTVQLALWQLGLSVIDAGAVTAYKKRAKLGMLWSAVRWQIAGMAVLVGLVCLGREWGRASLVGAAAVVLAALFAWLLNASELQWLTIGYSTYRSLHAVPSHVSTAAEALLAHGVSPRRIGVEYLKNDPILFVEDDEQGASLKRYDLIIW